MYIYTRMRREAIHHAESAKDVGFSTTTSELIATHCNTPHCTATHRTTQMRRGTTNFAKYAKVVAWSTTTSKLTYLPSSLDGHFIEQCMQWDFIIIYFPSSLGGKCSAP